MNLKYLKNYFMNLKIKYKIFISMFVVVLFICNFMGGACYFYFSNLFEKRANIETGNSLFIITSSLFYDINKMYKDISYFVSNSTFINLAVDIEHKNTSNFAHHYIAIQPLLENTITLNSLIDHLILIGINDEFYSTLDIGLKYKKDIQNILKTEVLKTGITWLPSTKTPIPYLSNESIPIVFPITLGYFDYSPFIMNQEGFPTLNILILINTNVLNDHLNQLNKNPLSIVYLADENGSALSIPTTHADYDLLTLPSIQNTIANTNVFSTIPLSTPKGDYLITTSPLGISELKLVSIISKKQLLLGISDIKFFTLITLSTSIIFSSIICIFLSRSLTHPLKKLIEIVTSIDPSKDTPIFPSQYKDEIGLLTHSFNQMSTLIKTQVECIKKDERLRHEAEFNMLAHQINPHFLYNTLECIHWEILSKNHTNAALMVESLGDFLRLSLNSTNPTTSIKNEINHTKKYIDIINQRTQEPIELVTLVSPELLDFPIVRLTLQPCVENAMKHAFNHESETHLIPHPIICISIFTESDRLHVIIEDNGKGINIDAAKSAIFSPSSHSKVGLKNVYERLKAFYGSEVDIVFSSIPFYRNTITFILPFYQ